MTKTTNYQLPQWEATDPIRRADFNAAMTDLDGGLTASRRGLLRLAEPVLRQLLDAMDTTVLTQEGGLLLNPLTAQDMAHALDGADWNAQQQVHIGRGPETSRTVLRDYCTNCSNGYTGINYNGKNTSLYEFTAPYPAVVTDFDLLYTMYFSATRPSFTGGSLTFTAYEMSGDSYVPIYEKTGIPFEASGTATQTGSVNIPVEVTLKKGVDYRFSLCMDSGEGVTGLFGFVTETTDSGEGVDVSLITVVSLPVPQGSHSRPVPLREEASCGVLLVRWRQEEAQGNVTAALDGIPMTRADHWETARDGYTEHEAVFHGAGLFRQEAALRLDLACGETDELRLTGYGVMLL